MTFSALTARAVPHHGKYSARGGSAVSYMIVHHWAGTSGGDARLVNPDQGVSASYILYGSGELVGQVPEEYRAWTSGSPAADNPAITVETQNSAVGGDWPVSDAALEKLARLAADLCERYGWGQLDRNRVRGHREFAQTACPGPYLFARLDWIVSRGNEILGGAGAPGEKKTEQGDDDMAYLITTDKGDILVVDHNQMTYWNVHKGIPFGLVDLRLTWLRNQGAIREVSGLQPAALLSGYREVGSQLGGSVGTVDIDEADVKAIAKAVNDDAAKRMAS